MTVDTFCQDHLQCLVWLVVVGVLDQHVQVCIPQSVLGYGTECIVYSILCIIDYIQRLVITLQLLCGVYNIYMAKQINNDHNMYIAFNVLITLIVRSILS